jgi:hypothetical protein
MTFGRSAHPDWKGYDRCHMLEAWIEVRVLIPFGPFFAVITSAILLVVLWKLGELGPPRLAVLPGWFLIAAYLQFGSSSDIVRAVGLLLQTMLALYLIMRWKVSG